MNKGLNLLGLAQRAGKLVSGEDTVLTAIRKQKAKIVLVTVDASDNTKKKINDKCQYYHIPYREVFTSEELSQALGKKRISCALIEEGFAKRIIEIIED